MFDINELNVNICDSQKLCEIIIAQRYFNLEKKISIICMQELAKRRIDGEIFDFESYIENGIKKLPPLDLNISNISSVISTARNFI